MFRKLRGTFTSFTCADDSRACAMLVFKLRNGREKRKNEKSKRKREEKMGKGGHGKAGSYSPIASPVKLSKTKYCLYDLRFSVHIV